ncbi:hypothetical protein SBADM41S_05640 [Streptomyces badius]
MSAEWKACETRSRFVRSKRSATAATAVASPEITTDSGPFTAAMSTPSTSAARTRSSEAATATIAPPSGSACMSPPRAATSVQASSRLSTPATCAAASSPMECPATTSGVTPQDSSSLNRATPTAKRPGWV